MTVGQRLGYALTIAVGLLVQTTWAQTWRIHGVYPDLFIVMSVCAGLTLGTRRGAVIGLGLGFLEGALMGQSMGSLMVSRAVVGLLAGLAETRVYRENLGVPLACVLAGTFVAELIFLIMSPNYPFVVWTRTILKEAPYNSLFVVALFPPLSYFTREPLRYVPLKIS